MSSDRTDEDNRIADILNRKLGLGITSVFDLVNSDKSYDNAIPILIDLLPAVSEPWIKQGVVRALTVKAARGKADDALLREFKSISPDQSELQSLKWAIGNALAVVATPAVASEVIELALDKRQGRAREMLVLGLANFTDERSKLALVKLLEDDEVCGHAIKSLTKLKAVSALPRIRALITHPQPLIRKEAAKAVRKLSP